ncbi:MAG: rod shape-determining protein MreC [Saccharofermentans sp.]|nr:rod shape-determining protein MreC [Saccharofermentans sp.]
MKKLFSTKWFIVLAVSLALVAGVVLSFIPNSPIAFLKKPVSAIVSPVQAFVMNSGNVISDFWAALTDGMAIREENENLKDQIADLRYQLTQNEEAAIRYEELKDAFHIRDTFSNYDIYGAQVLSREADEWFSVIRVGAGSNDGIDAQSMEAFPVLDVEMNLVGRVIEVGSSDSMVLPLLHEGFSVACKVNVVNGATMLVSGDASLKNDGLCLVTRIESGTVIEPGTEIVTSGEGGLFPEGIPVGTIVDVDYSNPLAITATLKPNSDIGDIEDVFVMIPYQTEEEEASDETEVTENAG